MFPVENINLLTEMFGNFGTNNLLLLIFFIMVQMNYLDSWIASETNFLTTSYNAAGALIGSMLRLPVKEG